MFYNKVKAAFRDLRNKGYSARCNISISNEGLWNKVYASKKGVMFNMNAWNSYVLNGVLKIKFRGDIDLILSIFRSFYLDAEHMGGNGFQVQTDFVFENAMSTYTNFILYGRHLLDISSFDDDNDSGAYYMFFSGIINGKHKDTWRTLSDSEIVQIAKNDIDKYLEFENKLGFN